MMLVNPGYARGVEAVAVGVVADSVRDCLVTFTLSRLFDSNLNGNNLNGNLSSVSHTHTHAHNFPIPL